jgi:putative DNA-invertase from lambdoid prophage Rac
MGQRAALYCRVSTADQSCERQERDLLDYAERCGYEVVGIFKETASGARADRVERQKVMALGRARKIDVVLVTELTRWGRSTSDLVNTLYDLQSWNVSLIGQTGFQCDLSTPQGRLIAGVMASISEFERDLLRERVKSGLAAAKARGKILGRQKGQNVVADKIAPKIHKLRLKGQSIRQIATELNISKTTVQKVLQMESTSSKQMRNT